MKGLKVALVFGLLLGGCFAGKSVIKAASYGEINQIAAHEFVCLKVYSGDYQMDKFGCKESVKKKEDNQSEQQIEREKEQEITVEDFFEESDFGEIQNILDTNLKKSEFSFWGMVEKFTSGQEAWNFSEILPEIKKVINEEIGKNKTLWLQCFSIAIAVSFFSNFSLVFKNNQVGETGFFIGYLMLYTMLFSTYYGIFRMVGQTIETLLLFMKALFPVYFLTVAAANGAGAASVMYQNVLLIIGGVELIMEKIFLPFLEIYFVLSMVNYVSKEEKLSKLVECLESFIKWGLKGLVGLVLGLHTVEGLLLPALEEVKRNTVLKTGGAIPVVGDTFTGVAETALSVAKLLKNAVGVTGILGVIALCALPVLKLCLYAFIFKLGSGVLEPVGEKRICKCFQAASSTACLLLYLEFAGILLFCITILILSSATG